MSPKYFERILYKRLQLGTASGDSFCRERTVTASGKNTTSCILFLMGNCGIIYVGELQWILKISPFLNLEE